MELTSKMKQLLYCSLSTLLIAVIALHFLNMNSSLRVSEQRWKSKISYQFDRFTALKNPFIYAGSTMKSTPCADDLVLKQVIDGLVRTPNKMQGKASNIKNNLSLARLQL